MELEQGESVHLKCNSIFNGLEPGCLEACRSVSYSTSQLDYILSWFLGNPTWDSLFRPLTGGVSLP